jgi:ADP-heptose:LPS heptosyltransferase
MEKDPFLRPFFYLTSQLTRWFPKTGAKILDGILMPLLGNRLLVDYFERRNRRAFEKIDRFNQILVIADIHIGDTMFSQTAISALKDFFPNAQVDYAVKKTMVGLLEGNPDINHVWPVFTGAQFPNESDISAIRELSANYDLVFNFCPFLPKSVFPAKEKTFDFMSRTAVFVRNERVPGSCNHIAFQAHQFIYDLVGKRFAPRRFRSYEGARLFVDSAAISEASRFLEEKKIPHDQAWIFLNPDTASPYTRIPLEIQKRLAQGILELPARLFIGGGHAIPGIEKEIWNSLPKAARKRAVIVPPTVSLFGYSALLDWMDVFISGDTGPLHLAAAWKGDREKRHAFRNRTVVLSVFGATPPRFSGYDSSLTGYLKSAQKAKSFTYQSQSACRNLSCMHKMAKSCNTEGCYLSLPVEKMLQDIKACLAEKPVRKDTDAG